MLLGTLSKNLKIREVLRAGKRAIATTAGCGAIRARTGKS